MSLIFLTCSVFTPYYSETVLYTVDELQKKNEDGISTLFYLQKIFPGYSPLPGLIYGFEIVVFCTSC